MRSLLTVSIVVPALALALSGCGSRQPAADETASEAAAVESATPVATDTAATEATATPTESETTPAATATPTESPSPSPSPTKGATVAAASPPASFGQCAICHNATKGAAAKLGPNLFGVYGTKAGEVAGYAFSPALKGSGLVWNEANLDKWLTSPMTMVPGTRMAFAGVSDPAERKALIAYLKAQR